MRKKISSFRAAATASTIGLLLAQEQQHHQAFAAFDGGRDECPCLPAEAVGSATINRDIPGADGIDFDALGTTFGIGCGVHGLSSGASICVGNRDPGSWCATEFCYVDPIRCDLKHSRSEYYPSLSYSFATCGNPDPYVRDPDSIHGSVLKIVVDDNHRGYQGTICPPDEQECTGTMVDFAEYLEQSSSGLNITLKYTTVPDWVTTKANAYPPFLAANENMSHAACVYGTSLSAVDMCIGAFTKNEQRAELSYFLEMGTTREYLVVKDYEIEMSLWDGIRGVFAPFSPLLWLVTFGVLFFLSILFVVQERCRLSALGDTKTVGLALYYACLGFFDQGRTFDQGWEISASDDDGLTWGGRFTLLALAVQILLTGASYTANLTNFLVKDTLSPTIGSIEEILGSDRKLCVLRNKISVLDMTYGKGIIPYAIDPSDEKEGFHDREELLPAMDEGLCCCAVIGRENLDTSHGKGEHCDKQSVGMPVIELPWGIPVSDKYAPPLKSVVSHFMQNGDWSNIERNAKPESTCHGTISNSNTEMLGPKNMLGAYMISFALAALGVVLSLFRNARKRKRGRSLERSNKCRAEKVSVETIPATGAFLPRRSVGTALRMTMASVEKIPTAGASSSRRSVGSADPMSMASKQNNRDVEDSHSSRSLRHNNGKDHELATIRDELAELKQSVVDLKQIIVLEHQRASPSK